MDSKYQLSESVVTSGKWIKAYIVNKVMKGQANLVQPIYVRH